METHIVHWIVCRTVVVGQHRRLAEGCASFPSPRLSCVLGGRDCGVRHLSTLTWKANCVNDALTKSGRPLANERGIRHEHKPILHRLSQFVVTVTHLILVCAGI